MDEGERKEDPSLPPDYVSLAQLQERWIQKQQEKKLKKKEEEEERERHTRKQNENQNQNQRGLNNVRHEKMAALSLRDVPRRRVEKDDREMSVIEDKGKGKEIVIDGFGNGEEKKKKKKKKHFRKKKSEADGEKRNAVEKEKLTSEIEEFDGGDGCEGVEILPANEVKLGIQGVLTGESSGEGGVYGGLKGFEEIVNVSMVEVLPRYGVRGEIPDVKRMDFRNGFRRNGDNRGSGYKSKK